MEWNGERAWSSSRGGADPFVVFRARRRSRSRGCGVAGEEVADDGHVVPDADAAGEEHGGAVGVESWRAAVGAGEGEAVDVGALERFAV